MRRSNAEVGPQWHLLKSPTSVCLFLSTQAGGLVVGGVVGSWLASASRATRTRTHSLADQTERFARAKAEGNARYLPPFLPPPPSPSPPPTCATNLFRCSSQGRRPHRSFHTLSSAPQLQIAYLPPPTHARYLDIATVCDRADTYALGPPYCTYGLRAAASCAPCVPEAQGSLPRRPNVLYVRGVSLGHTVRTAYRGAPGGYGPADRGH